MLSYIQFEQPFVTIMSMRKMHFSVSKLLFFFFFEFRCEQINMSSDYCRPEKLVMFVQGDGGL